MYSTRRVQAEEKGQVIVEAMLRLAGRQGLRETGVSRLSKEAGVSSATVYLHFESKLECFLAAHRLGTEWALGAVEAGCQGNLPWPQRVRGGLESLLALLAAEPELTRVVSVEAVVADPEGRRQHFTAIERFARLLEGGKDRGNEARASGELPVSTGLLAVSAVSSLLFDEIQAGRVGELPQHLPELLFTLLLPYLGPMRAAEEAGCRNPPTPAAQWRGARHCGR